MNDSIQDSGGNVDRVAIHPIHLRYMCEKMGLVREVSASETDALRRVGMLERRLKVLHERIDRLDDHLLQHSDHRHSNLSLEVEFSRATCDIADEFLREIEESGGLGVETAHPEPDAGNAPIVTTPLPTGNPAITQRVPDVRPASKQKADESQLALIGSGI